MLPKLQYISQGELPGEHIKNIETVLDAGVKLIQLRLKNINEADYFTFGSIAKELCKSYGAQLIINDSPPVAIKCNSDGVHLGLNDLNIIEARKIFPNKIIGGTANSYENIKSRCAEKYDYIGLGPYRFTITKEKLSPILGLEGYISIIKKMKADGFVTPVYAIGGIELNDLEQLVIAGVHGIAVSGLLTKSLNKEKLVKEITKILYNA